MRKFVIRHLWWVTSLLAFGMLIIHSVPDKNITVDNTSIILLIIIFLSPFISAIKKIKFGDFEAEIDSKEVNKIKEDVETKLSDTGEPQEKPPEVENTVSSIFALVETDPIIALAKLRIELEKVITKLHSRTQQETDRRRPVSLGRMVYQLANQEILPQGISGPIREVIAICNRAVHGEDIREKDAKAIVDIGTSLLENLYWHSREYLLKPLETETITHDELTEFSNAKYRLTTVIPYVENPVRNTRFVNQEALADFLERYEEYAEFIVNITKLAPDEDVQQDAAPDS